MESQPEYFRAPARLPADRDVAWHRLVTEQHGVITAKQADMLGLGEREIRWQVHAGRWQRVFRGVYATYTGPLPRQAELVSALLYAGAPALLSHDTAAQEWRLASEHSNATVHVTVPYNCSAISCPPRVRVHRSRAFQHIAAGEGVLARTSLADTIIDVASEQPSGIEARRSFVDLAGRARVSMHTLGTQLEKRPPWRYRRFIKHAYELLLGGAMSALEAEYVIKVESAHCLPTPQRQVPFSVDGRVLWEDMTYDDLGVALTIRLDGRRYHATPGVAFRDRLRDNAAELAGRSRLVYGWYDVTGNPCGVAAEVLTVLRRSGYQTTAERCSPACALDS